jgi:Protein of unknown function (DUF3558)
MVVAAVGAAAVLAACGSSGSKSGAADDKTTTSIAAGANTSSTLPPATSGAASGTPSHKPCDLLTKAIAETALGAPVRAAKQGSGPGNTTCSYRVVDNASIAQVYVTTYATKGTEAGLDAAASQFTNAYAVDGVGDAARVSLEDHAIGVLKGDVVIAIGMIAPGNDQGLAPVTEKQLVDVAKAVTANI